MYRRLLLIAVLGLTLGACVPYSGGGRSYYRSEVYTSPAPVYYYGNGPSYQYRRGHYAPPVRYYPAPRYYQPAPRYYPSGPRAGYRLYPNQRRGDHWGNGGRGRGGDHWGNGGRGRGDGRGGDHGRGRGGHR